MTKRSLPSYVYRINGLLYFRRGSRGAAMRMETQFPDGAAIPDALYLERSRMLRGISPAPSNRNWSALIRSYKAGDRYARLKHRTRQDYDKVLAVIDRSIGALDPAKMKVKDVARFRDENADSIRFANYCIQVLSILLQHAQEKGIREDNPAASVKHLATPDAKRQQHVPWTDEAVKKMREKGRALPRLIMELGIGLVQRPGDLVALNWEDFDGAGFRIKQGKTGKELTIPAPEMLLGVMPERPKVMLLRGTPILSLRDGSRMSYRRMAEIFRAERIRLGLERFDMHALRYRGVMELAWAGCSDEEIASYSGHETIKMVQLYAGKARQEMRAKTAKEKRK